MRHIPNFITSLNLSSGFIAIILASTGNISAASWFIVAAMVFDFLDGFTARLLKAYSSIGKELDSLADVVSFGVAPALIIYNLLNNSIADGVTFNYLNIRYLLIIAVSAIMPVMASIRLAIFNLDSTQTTSFKGLPTPANALAVISIVIASQNNQNGAIDYLISSPLLLTMFSLILSSMMVSRIPLFSLKVSNLKLKGNEGRYLLLSLILISGIIFGIMAIPLIIPLYILSSLISLAF
jgi:CDP-diacylglycerol---serine O-phosphatidyltransferase